MSPQFVDFDADGKLDIVAGTFDGSPHLSRGSAAGWLAPEQILDQDGQRIVGNQFWNFDTKKWDETSRCDPAGHSGGVHVTSAVAFDWDGDGDLDLLLGDHKSGRVLLRRNEGTAQKYAFAAKNELVSAGGAPIDVPGTVATLRLFDWNRDGLLDLLASGMGDPYGNGPGGGVLLFTNTGSKTATTFGAPLVLVPASTKGEQAPTRPDSGLYVEAGDLDGDGDFDLVVGGYSHWTPKGRDLTAEEQQQAERLRQGLAEQLGKLEKLTEAAQAASKGLEEEAANKKYVEAFQSQKEERAAIMKERQALQKQLEELVPSSKREPFVWFYENTAAAAK
jgi:hypothetical protein